MDGYIFITVYVTIIRKRQTLKFTSDDKSLICKRRYGNRRLRKVYEYIPHMFPLDELSLTGFSRFKAILKI